VVVLLLVLSPEPVPELVVLEDLTVVLPSDGLVVVVLCPLPDEVLTVGVLVVAEDLDPLFSIL
jgi:hypothetical protein